jgi:hypothetical protein
MAILGKCTTCSAIGSFAWNVRNLPVSFYEDILHGYLAAQKHASTLGCLNRNDPQARLGVSPSSYIYNDIATLHTQKQLKDIVVFLMDVDLIKTLLM